MSDDEMDSLKYLIHLIARLHDEVKVEKLRLGENKYTVITTPMVPDGEVVFGVDIGKGGDYTAVSIMVNGKVVG